MTDAQATQEGTGAESGTLPEPQVRAMFDRIAGIYDRLNALMTAGLDRRWRARAVELTGVEAGARVLDVATGTGDLALALAQRVGHTGAVVGLDFAPEMLAIAERKAAATGVARIHFQQGNAMALPFADDEFDAATSGFGVRNFSDLDQGLREMARVVRPGGRVVILEATTPQRPPLSTFFRLWFDRAVPLLGRFAGDSAAYQYLPASVRRFPGPTELAAKLAAAGFVDVRYVITAGGIIALHVGTVGP